jgi:hypothetical protein
MNFGVGSLRSSLTSVGISCFLLFASGKPAHGNSFTKSRTQVATVGREFNLKAGHQVTLKRQGLRIKLAEVKEDSRCPADVECVWAGNAAVRFEVSLPGRRSRRSLTLNTNSSSATAEDNNYHGYKIRLLDLKPYPRSTHKIAPHEYVATLLISKE